VEEGNVLKLRVIKAEPLERELRAFVNAVANRTPPIVSGADGRQALRLAQMLLASARANAVLPAPEALAAPASDGSPPAGLA
jgi:predicted dehydrogenase